VEKGREPMFNAHGQGFEELRSSLVQGILRLAPEAKSTAIITANLAARWDVHHAMRLYRKDTSFASILTISGGPNDAQAATCIEYLDEHFPRVGSILLETIQTAWSSTSLRPENINPRPPSPRISVQLGQLSERLETDRSEILVTVSGTPDDVVNLSMAFTWICAALRVPNLEELNLSTFEFEVSARPSFPDSAIGLRISLLPLEPIPKIEQSCWHALFRQAIIISDAPIRERKTLRAPSNGRS
jgi:hypothetical protein